MSPAMKRAFDGFARSGGVLSSYSFNAFSGRSAISALTRVFNTHQARMPIRRLFNRVWIPAL